MATLSTGSGSITEKQRRHADALAQIEQNDKTMRMLRSRLEADTLELARERAKSMRLANLRDELEQEIADSKILVMKNALMATATGAGKRPGA